MHYTIKIIGFFRLFGIFILCLGALYSQAHAQELRQERKLLELPVDERIPFDLQNHGFMYKGFQYRPELSVESEYNDNILAQENDEKSDFILRIKPGLHIRKEYDAHVITAGVRGNVEQFAEHTAENGEEVNGYVHARYVANNDSQILFSYAYDNRLRDRSSPRLSSLTKEPTKIISNIATLGINRIFNRLSLTLLGGYESKELEDGLSVDGATNVEFSVSNHTDLGGKIQARYLFPGSGTNKIEHILFADLAYYEEDYENKNFDGLSQDRSRKEFIAGFETEYKGLLFAKIEAGLIQQDFEDDKSTKDLDFGLDLAWNATPKSTILLNVDRDLIQDNDITTGLLQTRYAASLDYEVLHNFFIDTGATYITYDYEAARGADDNQQDKEYQVSLGGRYLMSDKLKAYSKIMYQDRQSNFQDNSFDRFTILFGLNGKL